MNAPDRTDGVRLITDPGSVTPTLPRGEWPVLGQQHKFTALVQVEFTALSEAAAIEALGVAVRDMIDRNALDATIQGFSKAK